MGAGEYADSLNQILGVSKAQQAAMMCGSMISWAIPAARPDRYDENGKLIGNVVSWETIAAF